MPENNNLYLITMSSGGVYKFIVRAPTCIVALDEFLEYVSNTQKDYLSTDVDSIHIKMLKFIGNNNILQI